MERQHLINRLPVFCLMLILTLSKITLALHIDNPVYTYDKCTGYISINWLTKKICSYAGYSATNDDGLNSKTLYYQNTSSAWMSFHMHYDSLYGGFVVTVGANESDLRGTHLTLYNSRAAASR